jgi:hypothetical protein
MGECISAATAKMLHTYLPLSKQSPTIFWFSPDIANTPILTQDAYLALFVAEFPEAIVSIKPICGYLKHDLAILFTMRAI